MEQVLSNPVFKTTGHTLIEENFAAVRQAVAQAELQAGRVQGSVTLVAASKTVSAPTLEEAIVLGHRVFGENRVQEAAGKWPELRDKYPDLELHLIGPLQSNKARDAVALFDVIQSVDRPSLCRSLARQCEEQGRRPKMFVQVNIGEEEQKAGVSPAETDAFLKSCRDEYDLDICGLMCIPPADGSPEPHFERMVDLAARNGLSSLSMGMSGDYALAVAHGATHVRVGTALFGGRV